MHYDDLPDHDSLNDGDILKEGDEELVVKNNYSYYREIGKNQIGQVVNDPFIRNQYPIPQSKFRRPYIDNYGTKTYWKDWPARLKNRRSSFIDQSQRIISL